MAAIRLQKLMADYGFCSRRKAEEYISSGHVKVNGTVVTTLGSKAQTTDIIEVDGKPINSAPEKTYLLLNKPRGVLTSCADDRGRKTVMDLVPEPYDALRLFPVGRLDYDTKGLVLLTNDGEFMNLLVGPKSDIEKEYLARVSGILTKEEIFSLRNGVMLPDGMTRRARADVLSTDVAHGSCLLDITIREGRYHQVKRMVEALGHKVLHLTRIRFGVVSLEGLSEGCVRELTIKEVKTLYGQATAATARGEASRANASTTRAPKARSPRKTTDGHQD